MNKKMITALVVAAGMDFVDMMSKGQVMAEIRSEHPEAEKDWYRGYENRLRARMIKKISNFFDYLYSEI